MPNPPMVLPYAQNENCRPQLLRNPSGNQLLAIEQSSSQSTDGNFIRLSCFSQDFLSSELFLLDSGASTHVVKDQSLLSDHVHMSQHRSFFTAEGSSTIHIQGYGTMIIRCATRNLIIFLKLTKVLFVPNIPVNVISVSKRCHENPISVLFTNSSAIFYRSEVVSTGDDSSVNCSLGHEFVPYRS